jgi:hypothetical protein
VFELLFSAGINIGDDMLVVAVVILVLAIPMFLAGRRLLSSDPPPEEVLPERSAPPAFGSERRTVSQRRSRAPLVVFVPGATPTEARLAVGWVLRHPAGGLCLTIGAAVEPGVILRLRHRNANRSTPWTFVAVRDCRQAGGCWELECGFVEPDQRAEGTATETPPGPAGE